MTHGTVDDRANSATTTAGLNDAMIEISFAISESDGRKMRLTGRENHHAAESDSQFQRDARRRCSLRSVI